jgi:hypothetical protein
MRPCLSRCWLLIPAAAVIFLLSACGVREPEAAAPPVLPTAQIVAAPQPDGPLELAFPGEAAAAGGTGAPAPAESAAPGAAAGAAAPADPAATPLPGAAPTAKPGAPTAGGLPDEAWGARGPGSGSASSGPSAPVQSGQPDEVVVAAPGAPSQLPTQVPGAPSQLPTQGPPGSAQPGAPTVAPTAAPLPPVQPPRDGPGGLPYPLTLTKLNFGVVGHLYYTDRATTLAKAREAGFRWFRQQIHWRDIEDQSGQYFWGELDNIVADVNNAGMLLMINITRSPGWYTANGADGLPQDPAALARFAGALAERYKGRVHAILIWNEQNLAYENGGRIGPDDPGHFVEIMAASYNAIKAVDPSIVVVAGAPASTATNDPGTAMDTISYLKAMYSYNGGMIRDYFDVQALHPGGSANPPDTLYPEKPSSAQGWTEHPSFYFRHVENQRKVMEQAGMGNHQVWITEYGWATPNSTPGYEFGNQISYETQRDYIVGAINYTFDNYPWVSNMFLWNLNFTVLQRESGKDPNNEQGSFSIVDADWSPRPAFFGVQEAIGRVNSLQP